MMIKTVFHKCYQNCRFVQLINEVHSFYDNNVIRNVMKTFLMRIKVFFYHVHVYNEVCTCTSAIMVIYKMMINQGKYLL